MRIHLLAALLTATAIVGLSSPSQAQQKTIKACQQEWRANKAANQAKGISEKAYVAQCRESAASTGSSAPASQPASSSSSTPATQPTASRSSSRPARETSGARPLSEREYASEAQAKAHCPSGEVVWANLHSKIYHFPGSGSYGHTKSGAYMCQADANSAGMRAAKNEKPQ